MNDTPTNITELKQPDAAPAQDAAAAPQPAPQPAPQVRAGIPRKLLLDLIAANTQLENINEKLSSPLVTPETETLKAQKAGIEKFLVSGLMTHKSQFLMAQIVMDNEYEPILRAITIIFRRVGLLAIPDANNSGN